MTDLAPHPLVDPGSAPDDDGATVGLLAFLTTTDHKRIGVAHLTFAVQHLLGLQGMPRRVPDYVDSYGFDWMNLISSVGAALLGTSMLPFLWNAWRSWRRGEPAGDDPWQAHTLEWATTSPPPADNFVDRLPHIRSDRPLWDLRHPELESAPHR